MAQVTITIPDAVIPRIRAAWDGTFTRQPAESDAAFFKRIIAEYTKKVVVKFEGREAGSSAQATAEADATADIVIT